MLGYIYLLNENEAAVPALRAMAWYSQGEIFSLPAMRTYLTSDILLILV